MVIFGYGRKKSNVRGRLDKIINDFAKKITPFGVKVLLGLKKLCFM
jgi:hypothetical protein